MPTFAVKNPQTLADLSKAIGAPVRMANRTPGRTGSTFLVWNERGECYALRPKGTLAARGWKAITGRLTFWKPERFTSRDIHKWAQEGQ